MTKKEMFAHIASVNSADAEIVEFCNHEIELLENRKASGKGMTKTQKDNEKVKEQILQVLASGNKMTVSELISYEGLTEFTNQKISALLRQLVDAEKVVKTIEKKKAYFALAE